MLRRTHVLPFLRQREGNLEVVFLEDSDGRAVPYLDRLCRLVRRLEGRPRQTVVQALRRQERRVRDARRLAGIAKALLDLCEFRPLPGSERSPEVREALFLARGELWPPVPGDPEAPYRAAADLLGLPPEEVERLLYADRPSERVLVRAPRMDGRALLDRYNLELARAVLLDAVRVVVSARGGWRGIFRAVKLARLMYRIEPAGPETYRVEITGPAARFVTRPQRYGARLALVVPALVRAPAWTLDAEILRADGAPGGPRRTLHFRLDARAPLGPGGGRTDRPRQPSYDSRWERALADDFAEKLGPEREGWRLAREETPIALGDELFLPDFTLRHQDGRVALVEILGFWTPEYLETKLRKVRAAGLENLILVVYRGLAAADVPADIEAASAGPVLWFANRPRIGPVMEAAERVASQRARTHRQTPQL